MLNPAKEAILEEVRTVASAEGQKIELSVEEINRILKQDNIPSLQADLNRHLPTEIDYINGAVVRIAKTHGISAPANSLVVSLIKFLESFT